MSEKAKVSRARRYAKKELKSKGPANGINTSEKKFGNGDEGHNKENEHSNAHNENQQINGNNNENTAGQDVQPFSEPINPSTSTQDTELSTQLDTGLSNGHDDNGYQDTINGQNGHHENGQNNGHHNNGHHDNGHSDNGHPDNGHPDNGHPDNGHPDNGHPDNGQHDTGHHGTGNHGHSDNGHADGPGDNGHAEGPGDNGHTILTVYDHESNGNPAEHPAHNNPDNQLSVQVEARPKLVPNSATLRRTAGNTECFDCQAEDPQWANVSYGVFICAACATIHSEFGLSVKPASDQCLTVGELGILSMTGNQIARAYWLATRTDDPTERLDPHASKDLRTMFIIEKYRGKWLLASEKKQLMAANHAFRSQPAFYGPSVVNQQQQPAPNAGMVQHMAVYPEALKYANPQLPSHPQLPPAVQYTFDRLMIRAQQLPVKTNAQGMMQPNVPINPEALNYLNAQLMKAGNDIPSFVFNSTAAYLSKKKGKRHR